jgi:Fe2+ transport system protein FeoA
LQPGVAFRLVEKAPFNGPLKLLIDNEEQFIGHEIARVLRVCSAEQYELN